MTSLLGRNMAEAAVNTPSISKFYCHSCTEEIDPKLPVSSLIDSFKYPKTFYIPDPLIRLNLRNIRHESS